MELIVKRIEYDGTPVMASMAHHGETIEWNIALFEKMSVKNDMDIFQEINGFWAYSQPSVQDTIFDTYKRIRALFDTVWDVNDLTGKLYILVGELFSLQPIEDINHWLWFHSGVHLPIGLRDAFTVSYETPGTRERTYLKDDYKWLVALSVSFRIMIPIWGEFIARTGRKNTVFKEYYAFHLLAHTNLIRSEPMERLKIYVEHSLPADKSKTSAVFGGISTEDFPIWVLGLVVVRRLSIGDVRGIDPTTSLVTFIYNYMDQRVKGHDKSFIGLIKDKTIVGQAAEGENNLSKLEGYKTKQEIAAGDIAIIGFYLKDPFTLALEICPTIDLKLVQTCLDAVVVLEDKQLWKPQLIITQWVLKRVVPPKGLLHVNKKQVLTAVAVAQAILWHREFFELAALLTAINQETIDELSVSGSDSRARISKEQMEQLDFLYPYSRKPVGKQRIVKTINPAVEAIESVVAMFSEHEWILTLPKHMLEKVDGGSSRYSTPHNAKILLANLVIEIAKRVFK